MSPEIPNEIEHSSTEQPEPTPEEVREIKGKLSMILTPREKEILKRINFELFDEEEKLDPQVGINSHDYIAPDPKRVKEILDDFEHWKKKNH